MATRQNSYKEQDSLNASLNNPEIQNELVAKVARR